jgi:hypothetical protein
LSPKSSPTFGHTVVGVKPLIVGAFVAATVNAELLAAHPPGAVTPISPEEAPAGTVTSSCVVVALETDALVPLKMKVFWPGVAENPVPKILTVDPIDPWPGVNEMMDTCDDACCPIDRMLPTASYVYVAVSPFGSTTAINRLESS